MKKALIYAVILLIIFLFEGNLSLIYAGPALKAGEEEKETQELDKKGFQEFAASRRLLYEKMAKRTKEYKEQLDAAFFTVNSHARKATEAREFKAEKELVDVLSDYNSVLGDLGLMQIILDLAKFADGDKFIEYYMLMENGFERLRDSFSLKNELFLSRISKLKNQDALRYEKKLFRLYRDYFEYDLRLDRTEGDKSGQR